MRALWLIVLFGCTSTRQLANPTEPRLRAPIAERIVVTTTTPWKETIDPNTRLRLRSADGTWSNQLAGRDLHVDQRGVWVDGGVTIAQYADEIELADASPELLAVIAQTRPPGGELVPDGDRWRMRGAAAHLWAWLVALESATTPTAAERRMYALCLDRLACRSADAGAFDRIYAHYAAFDAPVAMIRIHTPQQGWRDPLHDTRLIDGLRVSVRSKVGWPWERIAGIEVENLSGGKTLGAILGTAAAAIVVLPVAFVLRGVDSAEHRGGGSKLSFGGDSLAAIARADQTSAARGDWTPELASTASTRAPRMFSTGTSLRAIVRPSLAIDLGAASSGDAAGTGLIAKLRFMDAFEIGGGVRFVGIRDELGWHRSVTHVFAMGTHLALDAGHRFALPIGFEASGGQAVAHDLRFPWGFRYTPDGGRWFGTLQPATPTWMRTIREANGHWSLHTSVELGVTF